MVLRVGILEDQNRLVRQHEEGMNGCPSAVGESDVPVILQKFWKKRNKGNSKLASACFLPAPRPRA